MKVFSLYDPATGNFSGVTIAGDEKAVAANVPEGMSIWEGRIDHLRFRVNPSTGKLEPQDSVHLALVLSEQKRRRTIAAIRELEQKQARSLRESAIGDASGEARERLVAIDAEIQKLRQSLK